jgi:hypothetical protein
MRSTRWAIWIAMESGRPQHAIGATFSMDRVRHVVGESQMISLRCCDCRFVYLKSLVSKECPSVTHQLLAQRTRARTLGQESASSTLVFSCTKMVHDEEATKVDYSMISWPTRKMRRFITSTVSQIKGDYTLRSLR